MQLGASAKVEELIKALKAFISERVIPLEEEYEAEVAVGDRWQLTPRQTEIIEGLKSEAKARGWWNFFLTHSDRGAGLCNVDYAWLAQEMGRSHLAPEVFNCNAPDTGNMEVLEKYGTPQQQAQWLEPLLAGEIRSAFAMTEPEVASSDATNIACEARLENGEWVINGEKHYISGAGDPRCKILIVMVRTDSVDGGAGKHSCHSQILVPMDSVGVEIIRPMEVFGMDDAPHGHMHMRFNNVRVPEDNIILGPGQGFEISQGRLGPGRIHHCMRAVGMAERALELLCERAIAREAFGKPLAKLGGNFDVIANARMDIDMARLMTLQAAWMMDNADMRTARVWVSKIKVIAPNVAQKVIDAAIQIYGASGVSQDTPLAKMWMLNRTLRLADGPDEVHRMVVARAELARFIGRG